MAIFNITNNSGNNVFYLLMETGEYILNEDNTNIEL